MTNSTNTDESNTTLFYCLRRDNDIKKTSTPIHPNMPGHHI